MAVVDIEAEVLANTRLSPEYLILALAAPGIAAAAAPGQFVMLRTSPGTDPLLRRPFSIFEILRGAAGDAVGLTVMNKRVGAGTARLYDARPGDRIACLGPLGRPFEAVGPPSEAWLVAGGVGLAPFATLALALQATGTRTTLFYGARRGVDLFCADVFERLGVSLALATEDASRGDAGFVTVPLARAIAAAGPAPDARIYACGPTPMMRAVAALAAHHGIPCAVSLEQVMGCGLGGCYSCVVRVRRQGEGPHFVRTCVSGPVFDAATVVWEELGVHA